MVPQLAFALSDGRDAELCCRDPRSRFALVTHLLLLGPFNFILFLYLKNNWRTSGQTHATSQALGAITELEKSFFGGGSIWDPDLQRDWRRGGCVIKGVKC